MLNNSEKMHKTNMSQSKSENYKFKLTCQDKVSSNNDTKTWIELSSKIDHDSGDYKIFIGLLEKDKPIIIKVGNNEKLEKEYNIAQNLYNEKLPNFIKFYCYFKCLNNLDNITINTSLCAESGSEQGIIVMPYYNVGQIDKYKWTRSNFTMFKSVLKHTIFSLLYAYEKYGFIHRDTHLGNILLKTTKKKQIKYNHEIILEVDGMLPIIMDFDRSIITTDKTKDESLKLIYMDIKRILLLSSSECDIKTNIDENISKINKYISESTPVSKDTYIIIASIIDNMNILFIKSEMKLPSF